MKNFKKLIKSNSGIRLDLGCGGNKQPGFVGLDFRRIPGVDIVHNVENTPYPLPASCCYQILASHIFEHICPRKFMGVMEELWRISKVGGQLMIGAPYGVGPGFQQDPTHCHAMNQATWTYFDPKYPLYQIYKPKPWKIIRNDWNILGNMEVVLEKMSV